MMATETHGNDRHDNDQQASEHFLGSGTGDGRQRRERFVGRATATTAG